MSSDREALKEAVRRQLKATGQLPEPVCLRDQEVYEEVRREFAARPFDPIDALLTRVANPPEWAKHIGYVPPTPPTDDGSNG